MSTSPFTLIAGCCYLHLGSSPYSRKLWGLVAALVFLMTGGLLHANPESISYPLVKNFLLEELGTTAPIQCLAEKNGVLYAGADRLLIYDGASWTQSVYSENTPEIRCLAVQSNSKVWVGGPNQIGYFEKITNEGWVYKGMASAYDSSSLGMVWYVFTEGEDVVYVYNNKVVFFSRGTGTPKIWELSNTHRLFAQQTSEGILIWQPLEQGYKYWRFIAGQLTPVNPPEGVAPRDILLFVSEETGKWIYYQSGKRRILERSFNDNEERLVYLDDSGELTKALMIHGTSLGSCLYVPTYYSGLYVLNRKGGMVNVATNEGLCSSQCWAVSASQSGGVWVATDQGISYVYNYEHAWQYRIPGAINAIAGGINDLAVASNQGKVVWFRNGAMEEAPLKVDALACRNGVTYFGGFFGLYEKNATGPARRMLPVTGGGFENILLSRLNPNTMYVPRSAVSSLVKLDIETGTSQSYEIPGIPGKIAEDPEGNVWVATQTSGVRVYDQEFQKATIKISSKQPSTLAMHMGRPVPLINHFGCVEPDGVIVAGTKDLAKFTGTLNPDGAAWIYGKDNDMNHVGFLTEKDGRIRWEQRNIPALKRLKSVTVMERDQDILILGGETGLIAVDTKKLAGPELSKPVIEEIQTRDLKTKRVRTVSLAKNGSFELGNDERELNITLTRRIWGLLEPPQFESRLLPVDEEWIKHKYGEVISRKNLPAGKYKLEIRPIHLGERGESITLGFVRLPPWYASHLGITFFALVGVLAFYGAVKFRTRRIEDKNRELEEKIRERTQELAKANAAKSEFLAAMSHEIRNPMNGVVGIIKMLQEVNLGAREKYLLSTLHRCADQLRTTVDDVLDFSKIEVGEVTLHLDTFDLSDVVNSTIAAVDVSGERIELTSWAGVRPIVTGDQGKLTQILTNFLSNALKYGVPPRAAVDVFVLDEDENRCRVTIAVKNAGPDIPAEELPRLFESFQRGEDAKKRRIGGTGLGLAICKKYAEAMGGGVGASSAGGMTVFQLTLPYEKTGLRQASEVPMPKKLHARALAIEDEDYNRLVLGSILNKLGYQVDWASDGKTALQLAEQHGYDLVLTDLMLPDTDGGTLAKQILEISDEPKPPVFAITAYSTKEKKDECLAAGMAGFISKPITIEKLQAALQGWGSSRVGTAPFDVVDTSEKTNGHVSVNVNQLRKLGPLEFIIPDFSQKLMLDWNEVEKLVANKSDQAAKAAHRMISATLLVGAENASDQLRLLERNLHDGATPPEIEKLRIVCREEIEAVTKALRDVLKRQQRERVSEVQTPS